eukprot:8192151-Pyramimonas_sp.AAC.2
MKTALTYAQCRGIHRHLQGYTCCVASVFLVLRDALPLERRTAGRGGFTTLHTIGRSKGER